MEGWYLDILGISLLFNIWWDIREILLYKVNTYGFFIKYPDKYPLIDIVLYLIRFHFSQIFCLLNCGLWCYMGVNIVYFTHCYLWYLLELYFISFLYHFYEVVNVYLYYGDIFCWCFLLMLEIYIVGASNDLVGDLWGFFCT